MPDWSLNSLVTQAFLTILRRSGIDSVLETFKLSTSDNHAGELGVTAVSVG